MSWKHFDEWLSTRDGKLDFLLFLLEVSGEFPKGAYNALFRQQLEKLAGQVDDPQVERQAIQLNEFDWIGYIARSLRNAGLQDADIDPLSHEIVVRLLVQPGNLFRGWDGQPIDRRFKAAVRNAVLNLVEKRQTRRRLLPAVSIGTEFRPGQATPDDIPARSAPGDEEMVEEFRRLVRDRLGDLALAILDQRLTGEAETKSFVGAEEFGRPTSYRIKQTVKAIKTLAQEFARAQNDPEFLSMVERAMAGEKETVRRRFGARTG